MLNEKNCIQTLLSLLEVVCLSVLLLFLVCLDIGRIDKDKCGVIPRILSVLKSFMWGQSSCLIKLLDFKLQHISWLGILSNQQGSKMDLVYFTLFP